MVGQRIFIISTFIIALVYPSFATTPDIAANATSASCTDSALNTNNGPANIEVNWEPNTIELHWYNGNTEIAGAGPASCTYDGGLTPSATIPTKTGYTFAGWRAHPTYNFASLPVSGQGTAYWIKGKAYDSNDHDYTAPGRCFYYDGTNYSSDCSSSADFDELGAGEWKVHFTWGDVYGSSYCSAKQSQVGGRTTYDEIVNATGPYGKIYCWCQATGYKPNGSNTKYTPTLTIWAATSGSEDFQPYCERDCSAKCGGTMTYSSNYIDFLYALFGIGL